jgi:hypothetical protein
MLQLLETDRTPASERKPCRSKAAPLDDVIAICGIGGCMGMYKYDIFCPTAPDYAAPCCLLN